MVTEVSVSYLIQKMTFFQGSVTSVTLGIKGFYYQLLRYYPNLTFLK